MVMTNELWHDSKAAHADVQEIVISCDPVKTKLVRVKLERSYVTGKVDSGAEVSVMSLRLYNKISLHAYTELRNSRVRVKHAGGNPLSVVGEVQLSVAAGKYQTQHAFVVVDGLSSDLLIGEDFWYKHCKNHAYDRPVIVMKNGEEWPYWRATKEAQSGVRVREIVQIKPNEAVQLVLHAKDLPPNAVAYFDPLAKASYYTQAGLVQLNEKKEFSAWVYNHTPDPIKIEKIAFGNVESLGADAVCHTVDELLSEEFEFSCFDVWDLDPPEERGKKPVHRNTEKRKEKPAYTKKLAEPTSNTECALADTHADTEGNANTTGQVKRKHAEVSRESVPPTSPSFNVEGVIKFLPEEYRAQGLRILAEYSEVFGDPAHPQGLTPLIQHEIHTGDAPPQNVKQFRMEWIKREAARQQILEMLRMNQIGESDSPWNAPIVMVRKKDGSWRFCNDFRKLNTVTKKISFPLMNIEDVLDKLGGSSWYTVIDLSKSFWQVPVREKDQEKLAFSHPDLGHYQYKTMPMGLCNSTATLQNLMLKVLRGLDYALPYIDDIIIYARTCEELLQRTREVLSRLKQAKLVVNPKKTYIGLREAKYLGYVVSEKGVRPDPNKVYTIKTWPEPQNITQMRQFIGLANYQRRFIDHFAELTHSLTRQLGNDKPKTDPFRWGEQERKDFQALKDALSSDTVMAFPDRSENAQPFIVRTDASRVSEGASLNQEQKGEERIIAYASRTFNTAEQRYGPTEREAHAIMWAISQAFRVYLLGKEFILITDHKPCLAINKMKPVNEKLWRWSMALQDFMFKIKHQAGKTLVDADALSRLGYLRMFFPGINIGEDGKVTPKDLSLLTHVENTYVNPHKTFSVKGGEEKEREKGGEGTIVVDFSTIVGHTPFVAYDHRPLCVEGITSLCALQGAGVQHEAVVKAQKDDPDIGPIWLFLKEEELPKARSARNKVKRRAHKLYMEDDVVFRRGGIRGKQLYVPARLRDELFTSMHEAAYSAHLGKYHTVYRMARSYWWPGMSKEVYDRVEACTTCRSRNADPHTRVRVPVVSSRVPYLFETVSMDFQGPFPVSNSGKRYVLTFMCVATRWPEAFAIKERTAHVAARKLIKHILLRYGPIRLLLSDRDPKFVNALIVEVCKAFQVKQMLTASYHPETNAVVERKHRDYNDTLSKLVDADHKDWDEWLPYVQHALRTSINDTIGETPYYLVFGRDCPDFADTSLLPYDQTLSDKDKEWVQDLVHGISQTRRLVAQRHLKARDKLIEDFVKRHGFNFDVKQYRPGDLVMIRNHAVDKQLKDAADVLRGMREQMEFGEEELPERLDAVSTRAQEKRAQEENRDPEGETTEENDSGGLVRLHTKWGPKFIGPYRVIAKEGEVSYRVVHVNRPSDERVMDVKDIVPWVRYQARRQLTEKEKEELPVSGEDHGWDIIGEDEWEIIRIDDKRLEQLPGARLLAPSYRVVYKEKDGHTYAKWMYPVQLCAPDLIREYDATHPDSECRVWRPRQVRRTSRRDRARKINSS